MLLGGNWLRLYRSVFGLMSGTKKSCRNREEGKW